MDKKFTSNINHEDTSFTVYPDGITENIYYKVSNTIPEYYSEEDLNTTINLSDYVNALTNRIIKEYNTAKDFNDSTLADLDTKLTEVETYIQNNETQFKANIETIKSGLNDIQNKINTKNSDSKTYIDSKITELETYMKNLLESKKQEYGITELETTINTYFSDKHTQVSNLNTSNESNTTDISNLSKYIDNLSEDISGEYLVNLFEQSS